MKFEELAIIAPILKALAHEGYTTPTPIQQQAIPIVLGGDDLLGCAQTGTGKTAAFAIPILQLLSEKKQPENTKRPIRTLILTPTRELAIQIGESFTAYGKNLSLKHAVIFGGVPQGSQVHALQRGIDILIATPGRLHDLINQKFIELNQIEIFVLDEADRMLDMGFINDVKKVITKIPAKRQTLFFSATMPSEIQHLSNSILKNPKKVEVTPVSSTADTIQQSIFMVEKKDKRNLLQFLLKDKKIVSALVFTTTKHGADKVVKDLLKIDEKVEAIHGNKSQSARQRALSNFKDGTTRVLVATDIAARGIDVESLSHVINYDLPNIPETYVHRIGRTGRAGASGIAFSFCCEEEKEYLRDIQKLIGKSLPIEMKQPYPMADISLEKFVAPRFATPRQNGGGSKPAQKKKYWGNKSAAKPKTGYPKGKPSGA
jgi:ATP-dependent RNA helicase RhlE